MLQEQNSTDILITPEQNDDNYLDVYPNPASDRVVISYNSEIIKSGKIEISDVLGNKIAAYDLTGNSDNLVLDVSNYASGIYIVNINVNGEIIKTERLNVIK